jgi:hypothetical protein
MFYYVIYNSTVLNYSSKNKKLNTFIYGTVLYILSHGLINSYNNQFAQYIKSYFWIVLAIDIFAMYYLENFINPEQENETNLKDLIQSFYNNDNKIKKDEHEPEKENKVIIDENMNVDTENEKIPSEPLPYLPDDLDINENIDQMSDAGSDIDLDKFEMTLQN